MPVNIRGKSYVTVSERVTGAHEQGGFEMVGSEIFTIGETGRWWVRVTIAYNERRFHGTAEIKFNAPAKTADAESPLECAETSAVGRALAFAGFDTQESIASADEIQRNEPPATGKGATTEQLNSIATLCKQLDKPLPEVKGYAHAAALLKRLHELMDEAQKQKRASA